MERQDKKIIFLGGATVWPYVGISSFPEKGSGIYWHNLLRRKSLDHRSVHKACPVILGTKWMCNKWIGSDAQWNVELARCGTLPNTAYSPGFVMSSY